MIFKQHLFFMLYSACGLVIKGRSYFIYPLDLRTLGVVRSLGAITSARALSLLKWGRLPIHVFTHAGQLCGVREAGERMLFGLPAADHDTARFL